LHEIDQSQDLVFSIFKTVKTLAFNRQFGGEIQRHFGELHEVEMLFFELVVFRQQLLMDGQGLFELLRPFGVAHGLHQTQSVKGACGRQCLEIGVGGGKLIFENGGKFGPEIGVQ